MAGTLFAASAGVTGLSAASRQDPPSVLLFLGWPILALVGGVLLDQHPGSQVGRTLVGLSTASTVVAVWSALRFGRVDAPQLSHAAAELAAVLAVTVAISVPWAFHTPAHAASALGLAAVAGAGAMLVALVRAADLDAMLEIVGWSLAGIGTAAVWALVAHSTKHQDRATQRRVGWLLFTLTSCGVTVVTAWFLSGSPGYYATCGALVIGTLAIARLWLSTDFRPLDEHLLDLGLVLAVVASAGVTAGLVRLGSEIASRPSPGSTTIFTALLTAAMAAPAALWVRRSLLARRYGSGLIAPEDVAAITADLHARTDPRDLLDKAARVVATASGSKQARIVLGEDDPSAPEHWGVHLLEVGGDQVGVLLIESAHPEGPEARQQKVVAQLLPTVALVARAVGLAVEAEHARQDVARERDAERSRVMGDLHDGLGPALAGMSMRVQAARRTTTSPEHAAALADLAEGLGAARADLRRIVAGITPTTLDDGDLVGALQGLVASFRGATDSPALRLTVELDEPVGPDLKVAVYRTVAEGVTNALRHAAASGIAVCVRSGDGVVRVEIADDGVGGPVVPGVGLSSLARRAESLGGQMTVHAGAPGTTLRLELPLAIGAPT